MRNDFYYTFTPAAHSKMSTLMAFFFLTFNGVVTTTIVHGAHPSLTLIHSHFQDKFFLSLFLVADTQLYKRLCPSVRWLVGRLVCGDKVEKDENAENLGNISDYCIIPQG